MEGTHVVLHVNSDEDEEYTDWSEVFMIMDKRSGDSQNSSGVANLAAQHPEEEDDDCVILDGDPDNLVVEDKNSGYVSSDKEVSANPNRTEYSSGAAVQHLEEEEDDDCIFVSEKGPVACRDYPHSRHLCVHFPFDSTPHSEHCKLCHCYACDSLAPCGYWGTGISVTDHCHATELEELWKSERKRIREGGNPFLNIETSPNTTHGQVGETRAFPQLSVTCDRPNLSRSLKSSGLSGELTCSSNQPLLLSIIACINNLQKNRVSNSHAATSSITRPRPLGKLGDMNLLFPHQYSSDMSADKRVSTLSLGEVTSAQLYGQPGDEAPFTPISNPNSHAITFAQASGRPRPRSLGRVGDVNLMSSQQYPSHKNLNKRIATPSLVELTRAQIYGQPIDEATSNPQRDTISNSDSRVATSCQASGRVGDVNLLSSHQYVAYKNLNKRKATPSLGEVTSTQLYGQPTYEAAFNRHCDIASNSNSRVDTSSQASGRPRALGRTPTRLLGSAGDVNLMSPHQYSSYKNANKRISTPPLGEATPDDVRASGPFRRPHKRNAFARWYEWIEEED